MDETPDQIDYESNQPSRGQWILLAVLGILALLGVITFLAGGYLTATAFLGARNQRSTETAATATAIIQEELKIIEVASQWPLQTFEGFDNNDNQWIEGSIDDEYATIELSIDGAYTWEIESKQGFLWWVYPASEMVVDFYLAVDAINLSSHRDAPHGLVFHLDEDERVYYYFEIRDTQLFSIWGNQRGSWEEIIPYTTSIAIRPGDINHLEIVALNNHFYFLINSELVAETQLPSATQGHAGVAAGLSYEDQESTIVFDNFEVRAP
jgi:hypothetical protein